MPRSGSGKLARGAVAVAMVATTLSTAAAPVAAATVSVATADELAAAITAANASVGADVITVTADLALTSNLPAITGPLTIVGAEADRGITIDTAGKRLVDARAGTWTEPEGAPVETRFGIAVRNLTITGASGGSGSIMYLVRVHTTIEDVAFVGNTGGGEGNIHSREGGTTLRMTRVSVTGQTGTLVTNDHGVTPHEVLDVDGRPTLAETAFDNRLYVSDSAFSSSTGCVIYSHRWTSITDSTFSNSGEVCLMGVSTDRVARSSFVGTVLVLSHPWSTYWGTRYVQLDAVSIRPSLRFDRQAIHLLANASTICGQPIESYTFANPTTGGAVIGSCPGTGAGPTWTDQGLPNLALDEAVADGVSAVGDPAPTYAVSSGSLPAGLVLDPATGALTGTPTEAGDYAFELSASNDIGTIAASFSGAIPVVPAPPSVDAGPDLLLLPADGAAGDGDGSLDGSIQVRTDDGLRISLSGATVAPGGRLVVSEAERSTSDRGMSATGVPASIEAHDATFDTAEVCLPVSAIATAGRASDRLRLLVLDGTGERDITDGVIDEGGRLLVCGRSDRLGTFQAVLLAGDRVAGVDRYATAAALALEEWPHAETVFVASGEQHADAVVAGVLAAANGAPLLLVRPGSIPGPTARALEALAPQRIVVVGGPHAVHPEVVAGLGAHAPDVEVAAGGDRHETAARAAATGPDGGDVVYLVAGDRFADAVAAGAAAANVGAAFLSTDRGALPASTRASLQDLDPVRVVVVGGPSAISHAVLRAVAQAVPEATVERIGGLDRYATALDLSAGAGSAPITAATGGRFADVVGAVPFSSRRGASIVLLPPTGLTPAMRTVLAAREPEHVTVVGGQDVVSAASELGLAAVQPLSRPGAL